jgi:putative hydrolase
MNTESEKNTVRPESEKTAAIKLYGDYHTHTQYSHGTGTVMENARAAAAAGLKQIAITDHGFRHLLHHMNRSEIPQLVRDAKAAQEETGVGVLVGVESNLIGSDGTIDVKPKDFGFLDIVLCGFHKLVFPKRVSDVFSYARLNIEWVLGHHTKRRIEKNTDMYLRALDKYPIDIVTHIDYGAKVDLRRVAEKCAEHGTYLELNGRRINFTREEFLQMLETPVMFMIDSDAHSPDRVGEISRQEDFLRGLEFPSGRIANALGAEPPFRSRRLKGES